jgi:hypothetical protein
MPTYRNTAIVVGVLLIVCSAASILSAVPVGSTLDSSDYLTKLAAKDGQVVLAAVIEFIWAATAAGVAIALYPVLRKQNRAIALGSVIGRAAEAVLVLVGSVCLLVLLTLSQQQVAGTADPSVSSVLGESLLAARDWIHGFVMLFPWLVGAFLYYYLLFKSRLVPRWLSGWGLAGIVLSLAATLYAGFTQEFGFVGVNTALNAPIGIQEIALAVWLIAKGFDWRFVNSSAVSGVTR